MIDLTSTAIDPSDLKYFEFLSSLQGNILKGHGRNFTNHIFLKFNNPVPKEIKMWISAFTANNVTDSLTQLRETEVFKRNNISGNIFSTICFSATGVKYLCDTVPLEMDNSFKNGMKKAGINDPASETWDSDFQQPIDAMILIADNDPEKISRLAKSLLNQLDGVGIRVLGIEYGNALRNANGDGLEHFGYVDGISQPLFLKDDVASYHQKLVPPGKAVIDLAMPLSQVLVHDPLSKDHQDDSYGSYFVFRKLEQKVKDFKTAELVLADSLKLVDEDRERAGAMIIGRFEDGTPVTLNKEAGIYASGITNNFDYSNDKDEAKCPFHSHIRKANPRENGSAKHMMARRGIPYGQRTVNTDIDPLIAQMPASGVGLLFMSFQSSIENQFEFIQKNWLNTPDFPRQNAGTDPLIGQPDPPVACQGNFPATYGDPSSKKVESFKDFVSFRGGEYFYSPSISWLKSLKK